MYKNNKTKVLGLTLVFYCLMLTVPITAEQNIFGDMDLKEFHPTSVLICEATVTVEYATKSMVHKMESNLAPPVMFQSEDMGKVALVPPDEASADQESFGVQSLVGDKHYLIENTTDNVYTTLNIADNFDINNYYYLLFEDLMSKDSNTQVSLKISFGKTAAANISDSGETWNRTLINSEVIPLSAIVWYCLPLETNNTFPYVVNIEASNIDVSGYYVFQFDNDKLVYDARYCTFYLDSFSNKLSVADDTVEIFGEKYKAYTGTHDYKWFLPKNSLVDDLNATTIINIPAQIDFKDDVNTKISGWKNKNDLEDDLKESWKAKLIQQGDMTESDKIIDYNITATYWKFRINNALAYLIYEELQKQLLVSNDYQALVTNTLAKTIPLVAISTDKDDFDAVKLLMNDRIKTYLLEGGDPLAVSPITGVVIASVTSKPIPVKPTTNTEWTQQYSDILTVMASHDAQIAEDKAQAQLIIDNEGHVDQAAASITSIPQNLKSQQTTTILIIVGGSVVLIGILIVIFKFGLRK